MDSSEILLGRVINFGDGGFGFVMPNGPSRTTAVFFHQKQYCGVMNENELGWRLADVIGKEILFITGPGQKSGQLKARAWVFATIFGDDEAILKWARDEKQAMRRLSHEEVVRNLRPRNAALVRA